MSLALTPYLLSAAVLTKSTWRTSTSPRASRARSSTGSLSMAVVSLCAHHLLMPRVGLSVCRNRCVCDTVFCFVYHLCLVIVVICVVVFVIIIVVVWLLYMYMFDALIFLLSLRSCSVHVGKCFTVGNDPDDRLTYDEAEEKCRSAGARLCSSGEVISKEASSTGCSVRLM